MWTMIAIVSVVLAALVVFWRVLAAGQAPPDPNDPGRQHEVPGAHRDPPSGRARRSDP